MSAHRVQPMGSQPYKGDEHPGTLPLLQWSMAHFTFTLLEL